MNIYWKFVLVAVLGLFVLTAAESDFDDDDNTDGTVEDEPEIAALPAEKVNPFNCSNWFIFFTLRKNGYCQILSTVDAFCISHKL